VKFAHRYETVIDCMRSGDLVPDRDAMTLFFHAADILSDLVRIAQEGGELDEATVEGCLVELEALTDDVETEEEEADVDFAPMTLSLDMDIDLDEPMAPVATPRWQITFAPEPELFKSGNEPRHLMGGLSELGEVAISCSTDKIPELDEIDPEGAYLSWNIEIETGSSSNELAEAFDFAEGLSQLDINPIPAADEPPPLVAAAPECAALPFDLAVDDVELPPTIPIDPEPSAAELPAPIAEKLSDPIPAPKAEPKPKTTRGRQAGNPAGQGQGIGCSSTRWR